MNSRGLCSRSSIFPVLSTTAGSAAAAAAALDTALLPLKSRPPSLCAHPARSPGPCTDGHERQEHPLWRAKAIGTAAQAGGGGERQRRTAASGASDGARRLTGQTAGACRCWAWRPTPAGARRARCKAAWQRPTMTRRASWFGVQQSSWAPVPAALPACDCRQQELRSCYSLAFAGGH